jgi:translation initiation factor 4E
MSNSSLMPLHYAWVFWYMHRSPGSKVHDYNSSIVQVSSNFKSIQEFWENYAHLKRPSELAHVTEYHLFKAGIRPIWEDEANLTGGKWILRLKKGLASRFWEGLVLALIGDQFEGLIGDEITGIVVSIRHGEDIISVWNKTASDGRVTIRIRDTIKKVLNLPSSCIMEYKAHKASVEDKSSFRNTSSFM